MDTRRLLFAAIVLLGCSMIGEHAFAGGYGVLAIGSGGESHARSLGGEGGWVGRRLLLGLGAAGVHTGGRWRTINTNPILTYEEKRNDDSAYYGAVGWAVAPRWRFLLTAGVSVGSRSGRTTSYAGTAVEWEPDYDRGEFAWSGQLQYERKGVVIGGGFDNFRGGVARLGFRFLPAEPAGATHHP